MKTKDFSGIRNDGPLPNPQDVEIPDDIGDLLDDYIESASSMLEELEQAALVCEAGTNCEENAASIRCLLHKIKGESGMVGIGDISEFCHQAEFAFEEMAENRHPDMLLRFKDWVFSAILHLQK